MVIGVEYPENLIFFYKYGVLFLGTWLIMSSRLTEPQVFCAMRALLVSFVVVVIYVLLTVGQKAIMHPDSIATFRPNFPFTPPVGEQGGYLGDAHLLAAYLSTGLVAVFLFQETGLLRLHPLLCDVVLLLAGTAMVLTGSRNGIVTSAAVLFGFLLVSVRDRLLRVDGLLRIRRNTLRMFICTVLIVGVAWTVGARYADILGKLDRLLTRATSIDFSDDRSAMGRVKKLTAAADIVLDGPVVIGIGMQSSPRRFYDGAVAALLVSSGCMGLGVYAAIIYFFLAGVRREAARNRRKAEYSILLFVTANYILANLITEFFLVSRSVVPFCVFLGLMAKWIHISKHHICDHEVG